MTKNTLREKPQDEKKPKQKSGGGNIVSRTFSSVLSGSFLSREETIRALPFLFFLTLITILYIANGYYAERQVRKMNRLTTELKELGSQYIITKSDLMFAKERSDVVRRADPLGVKQQIDPPKVIELPRGNSPKK